MKTAFRLAALLALCCAASGCYKTTIRSGRGAGVPTTGNDDIWHSGLIGGLAEISGPYDLKQRCPNGWGELYVETNFVAGLVTVITSNIYTPQNVTIRCARGGTGADPR